MDFALEADGLSVHYDKQPVLWDISLQVPSGKIIGIVGPNGAGKSTLLKTALNIVKPLSGSIRFYGKPFSKMKKKIAYVPQREMVDWDFPITLLEVVLMGRYGKLKMFQRARASDYLVAKEALDKVGLLPFAERQISELSGGQQQRLFFARALVQQADIYLMDEPFQGIDAATEKVLLSLLKEMKKEGKTIFLVHHDLSSLQEYFDMLILLNIRLVAFGKTEEVLTKENLCATFSKSPSLFEEAFYLKIVKKEGF